MMDTPTARAACRKPMNLLMAAWKASAIARKLNMPVLKVALGGMLKNHRSCASWPVWCRHRIHPSCH
jgi:hypothetical protein